MKHDSITQTQTFFEFIARIKTRKVFSRIRIHKLAEESAVYPYRALEAVLPQEAEKQERLNVRTSDGADLDGREREGVEATEDRRSSILCTEARGYLLISPPFQAEEVIGFSSSSGNLDNYYVGDGLGCGVAQKLGEITSAF